ncbi:MAG: hypothetical protein PHI06_10665 [Desulfobulbaceae bacterium]|nr:hypothetical protein [Desulfobulbaceae bacterium]
MMRWVRWRQYLAALMLLLGFCCTLSACQPTAVEKPGSVSQGLVKDYGAAPLTLELHLDRQRLTVAQRLTVELWAETDEEHAVRLQEAKEFPGFTLVATSELKPELLAPNHLRFAFRYVLEPLSAGSVQLPVLTVEAWKKSEAKAAITTVSTEAVSVVVDSLLAKDDAGETITDIAPPLEKPRNLWLLIALGLAGVLVLALIFYLVRRRRQRVVPPPPPLPPHLLAYQALDRLLATDLLDQSQVKPFYEALSDILRHYIEQRFGIKAPEQTTEEFLAMVRPDSFAQDNLRSPNGNFSTAFDPAHRLLLRDFLSHCDLVKFARHLPARSEAEESVERCRRFVRETEPRVEIEGSFGVKT